MKTLMLSLLLVSAAAAQGVITAPVPGSLLPNSAVTFTWTAAGSTPSPDIQPYFVGLSMIGCGGMEVGSAWVTPTHLGPLGPLSYTGTLYVTLWYYDIYPLQLSHCYTYGVSSVPITSELLNFTHVGNDTSFQVGDSFVLYVRGPANSAVSWTGTFNGAAQGGAIGTTNAYGFYQLTGTMGSGSVGAWTETWKVAGIPATTLAFNVISATPVTAQMINTSTPAASQFVVGESFELRVTGPPNSAVSWTGTHDGVAQSGGTVGSTNASGLYTLTSTLAGSAVGAWAETWSVAGGSSAGISFSVLSNTNMTANVSPIVSVLPGDVGDDNYTTGTFQNATSLHPNLSLAVHKVQLPGGRTVDVPRGDNIHLANFAWRHAPAEDGRTKYTYTIDSREVYMIRVGFPDDDGYLEGTESEANAGWSLFRSGWGDFQNPAKGKSDEFSLTAKWGPGLVPVFVQGMGGSVILPALPASADNERVAGVANLMYNSVCKFAIGPVIPPGASKEYVMNLVERWAKVYGFDFLSPLLDGKTLDELAPATPLETEVVASLRGALSLSSK